MIDDKLSENFKLSEFLRSDLTERKPILKQNQYNPSEEVVDSIRYLVSTVIQPLRKELNYPMRVTSGFRCLSVNRLIGSSDNSQHILGEAVDLVVYDAFLTELNLSPIRHRIMSELLRITGKEMKIDVSATFYLFVLACLRKDQLKIDQIIHEFGSDGKPAWTHISATKRQARGQILVINKKGTKVLDLKSALLLVC